MKNEPRRSRLGAYSAYYNRPAPFEPSPLAEAGPGTAGGEYLRRYWHPIMIESELKDLPVALRLLGEDLVIFRDRSGEIGLLHRACAHRSASLEFGIVQEHGIMCCYHGWHFACDGTLIAAGAEPAANLGRYSLGCLANEPGRRGNLAAECNKGCSRGAIRRMVRRAYRQ